MKKIILFFLLFLSACYTQYGKSGFTGGYKDLKLGDDLYTVSFQGNAYTSSERAGHMALLRACEITLANGYQYFSIIEGGSSIDQRYITTQTPSNTTVNCVGSSCYARTYGGGTNVFAVNRPSSSMVIKCFKQKPNNPNLMILTAQEVASSIKALYKIKENKL